MMFCFIFIFTALISQSCAQNVTIFYEDINILRAGACVVALKVDNLLESVARLSAITCRTDWDIDGYTRITTAEDIKFMPGRCGVDATRDLFVQVNASLIGCAVATCDPNDTNVLVCYTDGDSKGDCGACEIRKPTTTTTTTTTLTNPTTVTTPVTTPVTTTPTLSAVETATATTPTASVIPTTITTPTPTTRNDSCVRAKLKCGRDCGIGQNEIFPFLDSCSLDAEGKISTCISPPDCDCEVDINDRAVGFGGKCAPYVCPAVFGNVGTLRWCRSCGYDCGDFQKDCLEKNGFCDKVSACQRLDMCAGWRESNCPGGICGGLAAVTDAMIPTPTVSAVIDRTADSVGYAIGLAIGLGCCVLGSICCFWAVKKSRLPAQPQPPYDDVKRPIDDNNLGGQENEVKEIIVRSRAEFAEEVL